MASPKLKFIAEIDGVKQKTFTATYVNTIYAYFNKYCQQRGYTMQVKHPDSFGYLGWSNGVKTMILKRIE